MTGRLGVALGMLGALGACGGLRHLHSELETVRTIVRQQDCRDGSPAKVLVDVHCVDGICGVTCAPDRWRPEDD